jgi:hypothetical protein
LIGFEVTGADMFDRDRSGLLLRWYVNALRKPWRIAIQRLTVFALAGGFFLIGGVMLFFDRAMYVL